MQKEFLVLIGVRTDLSLKFKKDKEIEDKIEFKFKIGDDQFILKELHDERDELIAGIHKGLLIEARVFENDIDKAANKARDWSEFFASTACLETGSPVYGSKIILVYEITPKIQERVFRQYFYDLNNDGFNNLFFNPYFKNANEINNIDEQYKYRILRAIRWFRKGFIGDDPIDQFSFFWQGLESLNPVLSREFNVPITQETPIKCKNCKKLFYKKGPAINGIKALYDDLGIDETTRKQIKNLRIGIVHGHLNITNLYEPTIEILPKIAEILHHGISKVIKINYDKQTYDNIKRGAAPVKLGDFVYIEGLLIEQDPSNLGVNGYYPYWHPEIIPKVLKQTSQINFDSEKNFLGGCEFKFYGIGVSGKDVVVQQNS